MTQTTVVGAGAWGTALAIQIANLGHDVKLWVRSAEQIDAIRKSGCNDAYFPGVQLPERITLHNDLPDACVHSTSIICVVPSIALRSVLTELAATDRTQNCLIACACKGIERESGLLPHQVVAQVFGQQQAVAAIGGPSFAGEVINGKPTAIVIASNTQAESLVSLLHGQHLRVYTTDDMVGVEMGGALKNVIAVAAGISDGLGLGDNARAALLTRGLNEMLNITVAVGGAYETSLGLAGLGDLVLSCCSQQSRNYQYGYHIGQGLNSEEALAKVGKTVEAYWTTSIAVELAGKHHIQAPICEQIQQVICGNVSPQQAVQELLKRPSKMETLFQRQ